MLELLRTHNGCPVTGLQHFVLPNETLLLHPIADTIVILNARTLDLVRSLAFWEVFPGSQHSKESVKCISVDSGMRLVVAAMATRIAVWSLSSVQEGKWRVHSSLVLPDGHEVTTLDCKSGLLAVGTRSSVSVYTLILENDLPTWSQKWMCSVTAPTRVRFSPSLMYFATTSLHDNIVRIYLTTSGRQTQGIPHPRPVHNIKWRDAPKSSSRDDLILYSITSDATLRIFLPVLDSPQHLQLHGSLDLFSALPFSVAYQNSLTPLASSVFWLDRSVINDTLAQILRNKGDHEDGQTRRAKDIRDEGWDLFLRVLADGSLVVTGVANIDRRPPTLLRQFTLLQSAPGTLPSPPRHLYFLKNADKETITLVTSPPLATYDLEPLSFFDARSDGLKLVAQGSEKFASDDSRISRFVRTPEGKGVAVLREDGGQTWMVKERGSKLISVDKWTGVDDVVVLERGNSFATYSASDNSLTLHSDPPATITLPPIISLFTIPSIDHTAIVATTAEFSVIHIQVSYLPTPSLDMHSHSSLPLPSPPRLVLPVDPMAWSEPSNSNGISERDIILSVSDQGELAFWGFDKGSSLGWRCTGKVKTGRTGIRMARCSSAKKSVLVVPGSHGEELTIWDSKESEFSTGLEYRKVLNVAEPVNDLDWTSTLDSQSVLAVGFAHRVELLCEQRMTYFDEGPRWGLCWSIDIGAIIPHPISDSIWLAHGSLLIGAGHQMLLFGQPKASLEERGSESLFEYVARQNGPLTDYHPQMLLQCLLWGKIELVKDIIVNLYKYLQKESSGSKLTFYDYEGVPVERFLKSSHESLGPAARREPQYSSLFNTTEDIDEPDEDVFSRSLVDRLLERLESDPLPHMTANEHAHLLVLIQTALEVDEQRRALDTNGTRYLTTMRSFYIFNRRILSSPSSPQSNGAIPRHTGWRERLRFRDMIWAFHSESQDLMLGASTAACNGKMCWPDARALGIFIWLNSNETMRSHMELLARNQYMTGDSRDPTACSLFYFALGKANLVHGLWRQAAWHKEQGLMLKFLSNDFTQPRWRTAALKNAYALLSKQRFEYAAAFFLLGGSLKDAVNVCIRQLDDFQLAVALARVVEKGDDGPILQSILNETVIPTAFKYGNRWLASWAFWLLKRKDLSVRILVTPLQEIADELDVHVSEIGEPHYDDPSLALLFSQLKMKTLQTAKGTSEISGRTEFNFVLQIARVFCRMGCHVLALDLVRSWSFSRPSTVIQQPSPVAHQKILPSSSADMRGLFAMQPALRRTSTIMIDMDIPSVAPTPVRTGSPELPLLNGPPHEEMKEEGDLLARKAGLGKLLKSARQDVNVPEFDMGAFF
ncbi:hypothetical protein JAAARDRAFT_169243 [Jaapia argillacea MUCL 33604]|uniref:RAVE complex protein Rav1 C-terminal domain-containing protein n=1 Tax=Jaapia argillacea MUCL 33604 TaxID=933084 RepID=A0A067QBD4_9AGAM|nr:hypothetical protein JAAARDRAFT_169243 [Jaapia argillacea MUCL 33604]